MRAMTFSKQWIHFLRSDLWPPTSTILPKCPFQSSGLMGAPQHGTQTPATSGTCQDQHGSQQAQGQPLGPQRLCVTAFHPQWDHYCTHYTDEETEVQKGKGTSLSFSCTGLPDIYPHGGGQIRNLP